MRETEFLAPRGDLSQWCPPLEISECAVISASIAPACVVHDTRTVPYSAWGRKTRREGGGIVFPRSGHFARSRVFVLALAYSKRSYTRTHSFEDGITRLYSHSLFRGVLRHDGRPFGARAATGGENVSAERSSQSTQPRARCSPFGRGAWRQVA